MSVCARLRILVLALVLVAGGGAVWGADPLDPEGIPGTRLPPRLENRLAEALRDLRPGSFRDLDALLDRAQSAQGVGNTGYTWRHYYTYCAAVQAAFVGADDRARRLLDTYLDGVGGLEATNQIPALILTCPALKSTRKVIAAYRESASRRWGDDRWSLHHFRPDQLGWEYESALALRSLVTGVRELPGWIERSAVDAPSRAGTCRGATMDARRLVVALRCRQLGDAANFRRLLTQLRDSESPQPIPDRLLARIESPPRVMLGLRWRAVWAAALILALLAGVVYRLRGRARRRAQGVGPVEAAGVGEFDVARTDPWVRVVRGWLGVGAWGVVAAGLVFIGGAHWLLAWSEETLWPQGYVVDRSFLDYFSFPYSFALLIPAFLGGSLLFYSSVQKWLPGVLRVSLHGDESDLGGAGLPRPVLALWRRYAAFCNSRLLIGFCLAVGLLAALGQKIQWARDPGTAFVDLRYPGHSSLTAVYFTVVSVVTIYAVLGCMLRGGAVLSFVSQVYTRTWRERAGVRAQFDYTHPDGCSGLQPLGWILLEYYVLLLLLAAQILLNLLEKLRFYESLQIVLQHTLVSVGTFAFVMVLTVPYLVGRPLLTVHLAMRRYRRREAIRVSEITDAHRETLLQRAQKGEAGSAEARVFQALLAAEEEIHAMPLWPMDLKVTLYFIASHVVPLLTFVPPLIERWLGIKLQ